MRTIPRRALEPADRTITFSMWNEYNGAPMAGRQCAIMLSPNGAFWRGAKGMATEIGAGTYRYELHRDEIDFVGTLAIRIRALECELLIVEVAIVQATNTDDPAIYFEIAKPEDGDALRYMARDRGLARRPGETDEELRRRIRVVGRYGGATRDDIRRAVEETVRVVSCNIEERTTTNGLRITVEIEPLFSADSARNAVETVLRDVMPAGVPYTLDIVARCTYCETLHDTRIACVGWENGPQ